MVEIIMPNVIVPKLELPPRWRPMRPHKVQLAWMNSTARFNVVPAGRRSGKTERAKRKLVKRALSFHSKFPNPSYFAAAPTRQQAKDLYWEDIKQLSPREWITDISESNLRIKYITGASITVVGLDKPERIEGQPWDGGIIDEIGNVKAKAWPANIRPALSDRKGWCDLIGVPEGRNHYYDIVQKAISDTSGEWAHFSWPSADIIDPDELESARADLDELTFQQEYEASFLNFEGRIYYPFDRSIHVSREIGYDPRMPIAFCFDFNVSPGVAVIAQEFAKLPNGLAGTAVIGEVYIPNNSNTPAVCRKLVQLYSKHMGPIICYGDATGGSAGSAKVLGSDWDLIRAELKPVFGERLRFSVPNSNPAERSRVNAVNSRIRSGPRDDPKVRLMVHPNCTNLIRDFEGVVCLAGGAGEIDKKKDLKLTHISDALGYYIADKFPIVRGQGPKEI